MKSAAAIVGLGGELFGEDFFTVHPLCLFGAAFSLDHGLHGPRSLLFKVCTPPRLGVVRCALSCEACLRAKGPPVELQFFNIEK